jgi:adenosine kinase
MSVDSIKIRSNFFHSDAFAGGLVAGIVAGKPLDTCIDLGQWLAKLSIRELGPSFPFPKQTYQGSS